MEADRKASADLTHRGVRRPHKNDSINFFRACLSEVNLNAHERVMEFTAMESSPLRIGQQGKLLVAHSQGRETIMANVSKVILGVAVAAVSIASPALAAHKSKPISAHHNGYVTQSGVRAFASVPIDDPAGRPYPAVDRNVPLYGGTYGGD
jgi:hypothetical protein